ncbi:MAG: ATP-binding protein, partial [Gammaproteobacteria bacterium]|nr:ATP-binding protein [Gammaproteobacteria bacterium]NNJ85019.1 ATP-binding protein [Gammaproteobacteria bacterium]
YGLGRKRTDLLVQWPLDKTQGFHGPMQRVVIELKIQHQSLEATLSKGLVQTTDYMDRVGAEEGYLVIFNRNSDTLWEERIFVREELYEKYRIGVWGM